MRFKITRKGYVQSKNGTLRLPPASTALQAVKGLKITWKTPVLPAIKPKPKP